MIWLNVLQIIIRIFFGLCCIGFTLGLFLHDKHPILERVWLFTGFLMLGYGFTQMLVYAVLGSYSG